MIANDLSNTTQPQTQMDSDALLQASRRLDWRFLLPDPALDRVAYIGLAHGALVESLRLFSTSLTVVDPRAADDRTAQYDVVVATDPTYAMLQRAVALVRPGGCLYVETHAALRLRRRGDTGRRMNKSPRLRYAADYVTVLRRLGLASVEAHWHWPNFESCAEIVPLDDRAALLLAFARRQSGPAARMKSTLGRWLLRGGLFARLVPCFSVVGRKPD